MSGWIGVIGALVGGFLTIVGQLIVHWLQTRKARALDEARTKLLRQMLAARDWRKLSTLSRVIGADADTTRRLLIELSARGSGSQNIHGSGSSSRRDVSLRLTLPGASARGEGASTALPSMRPWHTPCHCHPRTRPRIRREPSSQRRCKLGSGPIPLRAGPKAVRLRNASRYLPSRAFFLL